MNCYFFADIWPRESRRRAVSVTSVGVPGVGPL